MKAAIKRNSNNLLTAAGCVGVVTTAYLAARGAHKAAHRLESSSPYDNWREKAKSVWTFYIPAAASGCVTIAAIVGSNRLGNRRAIAAQALLAVSERAYSEYRNAVVEEYGENKDNAIRDRVADKLVADNPPPEILIAGSGDVLVMEMHTGRYFSTTMEKLRRAANEVNRKLLIEDYQTLDDFYYEMGWGVTSYSSEAGWSSPKLMELEFSSVITENGRPCLVVSYNYLDHL